MFAVCNRFTIFMVGRIQRTRIVESRDAKHEINLGGNWKPSAQNSNFEFQNGHPVEVERHRDDHGDNDNTAHCGGAPFSSNGA
jgi:hypothetical protein